MNIYLAGSPGCWRDALVPPTPLDERDENGLPVVIAPWMLEKADIERWPTAPNTWVAGGHNYVGSYWADGIAFVPPRHYLAAIDRADLVFAFLGEGMTVGERQEDCSWLADIELGYAVAAGCYVYVVTLQSEPARLRDWWWCSLTQHGAPHLVHDHNENGQPCNHTALYTQLGRLLPDAIKKARKADRQSRRPTRVDDATRQGLAEIAQWTSDPRARAEAQRLLARLGGSG